MVKFMGKQLGLEKGYYKGDRTVADQLWKDLATVCKLAV